MLVGKQTTEIPPDFKAYGSNQDDGIFSQEYEGLGTVFSVIVEADKDKKSRIIRSVIKLPVGKGQSFSSHCKSGDSQVVAVTGPIKGKKRCDGFEPKKAWVLNREKMKFEPTKISSVVCEETDYSVCDD